MPAPAHRGSGAARRHARVGIALLLLLLPLSLLASPRASRAEAAADYAAYVELLGNGFVYTVNFERRLRDDLWLRVGFETVSWTRGGCWMGCSEIEEVHLVAVPVMVNRLIGRGPFRLEAGLGLLLNTVNDLSATATLGFRYQPQEGGFVFRLGFTPIYPDTIAEAGEDDESSRSGGTGGYTPWLGLSFGWSW